MSDFSRLGAPWIIDVAQDGDPEAVAKLLSSVLAGRPNGETAVVVGRPTRFVAHGGVVLAAMNDEQLDQLKNGVTRAPREDVLEAVRDLVEADLGIVAVGDRDSRRIVREMFPRLPAPFEAVDGQLIADDLRWAGLSLKLPPEPGIRLTVETTSPRVAQELERSLTEALELAKTMLLAGSAKSIAGGPLDTAQVATGLSLLDPQLDGARIEISFGADESHQALIRELVVTPLQSARQTAQRVQRVNGFKQIALAMHNYHSAKKSFPTHASYDEDGRPLLSWRVHLLPYLDQRKLYEQFHLDEPWDSEHNRGLIERMPEIYADPDSATRRAVGGGGRTTYVVPYGKGLAFEGHDGLSYREFKDGTSNTVLLVEVTPERSVVWTKPADWEVDQANPLQGVKRSDRDGFVAAICDGSVHYLANDVDPEMLRSMFTRAGGEVVEW